jgi:tetratricopeptide (TPR) repeat protein
MGDLQKAISLIEDVLLLVKRIKFTGYLPYVTGILGVHHIWSGEWDKSLKYLTEALYSGRKIGEYQQSGIATSELGRLFLEMENYEEAERYLNESNSIYEKAGDTDNQITVSLSLLSTLYLRRREIDKAKELIEKVYQYATRTKNRLVTCDAELLEAMLFREQKNWELSIQHFEKSLQEAKTLDIPKWNVFEYAEILYEYGLMYLERNREDDRETAFSLLNQALGIYQEIGAKKRIEKVISKMTYMKTRQLVKQELTGTGVSAAHLPAYITTGYADLDKLLLGGIPEKYAIILTSPSCNERDLTIRKYLETGARNGEVTFYLTTDPSEVKDLAEEFPSNFHLLVCNPQAGAIFGEEPNVIKLKGVENLTDINIALTLAIRRLDASLGSPRRICVGLVSDVLLQHHAVQTRRWLTALTTELKSAGFTTLSVFDPEMHSSQDARAILDLFDGEINIYEKETEKGLEKFLKIKKMSNQEYLESELPLKKEDLKKRE